MPKLKKETQFPGKKVQSPVQSRLNSKSNVKTRGKIKSPVGLKRVLAQLNGGSGRKGGARIVFTNGCFDILHKGHITYLEKARSLGDYLVVALNSDASVKRIKGPGRPLNPLSDRLEVIAALEAVDFVTWFDEETPLDLILTLKPNFLVKGGDWSASQIVGGKEVLGWGGKVRSLRYEEGRSTTRLIKRAQGLK